MLISSAGWNVWKWGLAAMALFTAMVAILSLQRRPSPSPSPFDERAMWSERTAGLAAYSSTPEPPGTPKAFAMAEPAVQADSLSSGSMITHSVSLKLTSRNIAGAQMKIDETVRRFQGFADKLVIRSESGVPHTLSAVLRFPSDRLQAALEQLRTAGDLAEESQTSEDVADSHTDLLARLANARRTEQRLLELLSDRAGKLGEVVEVEKEIGGTRDRIERMQIQQRRMEGTVRFASIELEMTDQAAAGSGFGGRLKNAFLEGYNGAIENTLDVVLAVIRYGPTALIYILLASPLVLGIRRLRQHRLKTA